MIILVSQDSTGRPDCIATSAILEVTSRIKLLCLKTNILASRTIHTRAYPNPNPPEIVDNPESILRKYPTPRRPTISRHIHRANSTPENFTALSNTYFDLDSQSSLPRTKSFSALDQPHLELPVSLSHSGKHIRLSFLVKRQTYWIQEQSIQELILTQNHLK